MSDDDRAGRRRPEEQQAEEAGHRHPGGTAAILGVQLLRFSGIQGLSLGITNVVHYGSIVAVGAILGPSDLGAYSLLLFLTGLVTQIIHLLTKPGTIMRVFGGADEEDDDDEDEERPGGLSERPPWTLGVGIVLCVGLAALFIAAVVAFQSPIANLLLGDPGQGRMVVWAGITAGAMSVFRLCELALWFERRPSAFLAVDASRPTLNLGFIIVLTLAGMGLEGAILGAAIGTVLAMVISILALWRSFEPAWSFGEAVEILKQSRRRVPIVASMWVLQNADTFILSRYVDHHDLGVYNLASRTGFVVAILPQGFRIALRPLRKGAAYIAMRQQYGNQVANGQLLAYFVLLCITSILAMFMLGEAIVHDATGDFAKAAGLIPLAAGAMTMPALYRTVSAMTILPNRRRTMVVGIVVAALAFIGLSLVIVPAIGIYGPPTAILAGFVPPLAYIFVRSQTGEDPIDFPYWSTLRALAVAVAIAVGFELFHPTGRWPQLAEITALMGVWFALLFGLRIVPEHHRRPILHMARSAVRGSALEFRPEVGLRALKPKQRAALRVAVVERLSPSEIEPDANRLVRCLRRAGREENLTVGDASPQDGEIALFLFSNEPMASRQARMRALRASGADPSELHTLEHLVERLAKAPDSAWGDDGKTPRRGLRARLRRA